MKNLKYLLIVVMILGGIISIANYASLYSGKTTHLYLTEEMAKFFNGYFEPKITLEQIDWLRQGAKEEDTWPRNWFYHFYDPIHNRGFGHLSAKEWVQDQKEQTRTVGGNHTWQKAINDYNSGNIREAFVSLGHIIHLIEDMGVPAHTREDPHHSLDGGGDPLENWAKMLPYNSSFYNVATPLIGKGVKPAIFSDLDKYFDKMASFSNNNFFSRDTITGYENPKIFKEGWENGNKYAYGIIAESSKVIRLTKIERDIYGNKVYFLDETTPEIQADYFSVLADEIVINGAGVLKLFFNKVNNYGARIKEVEKEKEKSFFARIISQIKNKIKFVGNIVRGFLQMPKYALDSIANSIIPEAKYLATNPLTAEQLLRNIRHEDKLKIETEVKPPIPPIGGFTSVLPETEKEEPLLKESETFLVKKIIDGDTIILDNNQKIRLIGINAPELPNACFAKKSKEENEKLLLGKVITMEKDISETDDYGRLLRYIYLDSLFINDYLVREGFAYNWAYGPDIKYKQQLMEAKEEAEKGRKGLWGDECHPLVVEIKPNNNYSSSGGTSPKILEEIAMFILPEESASSSDELLIVENVEETIASEQEEENQEGVIEEQEENDTEIPNQEEPQIVVGTVVFNEIAWAGTNANHNHEWIELYNKNDYDINLTGWTLQAEDGPPFIELTSTISAGGYFLLERTSDQTISNIIANQIYTGALSNHGEKLILKNQVAVLIDELDYSEGWEAGENKKENGQWQRRTMEKVQTASASWQWQTYQGEGGSAVDDKGFKILGTPRAINNDFQEIEIEDPENQESSPFFVDNDITEDTIWTLKNSPYHIYDGAGQPNELLEISQGATLTIEKGVIVKFYNPGLKVFGTIKAEGSSDQPIVFTSPSPQDGDWSGIWFDQSSQGSVLDNVIIEYAGSRARPFRAGSQYSPDSVGAAIKIEGTSVIIKNSTIRNNLFKGIWLINSPDTIIENTTLQNNNKTDSLSANQFPWDRNMAIYLDSSSPEIKNSIFQDNLTAIYVANNSEPLIQNNIFSNNIYPVWVKESYPAFSDNQAINNHWNGLIFDKLTINRDYLLRASLPIINYAYPYDGIIVDEGKTLTIAPGTIIKSVQSTSGLVVNGTLKAEGENGKMIIFTSFFDDEHGGDTNGDGSGSQSNAQAGSWGQIVIGETSDNSSLEFVAIQYGGTKWLEAPAHQKNDFVLIIEGDNVVLDHLIIKDNNKGIYIKSSSEPIMSNILYINNDVDIEIGS